MKPVLTIITCATDEDVIARGISEDVTLFEHVHFSSYAEFARYIKRYEADYRIHCDFDAPNVGSSEK